MSQKEHITKAGTKVIYNDSITYKQNREIVSVYIDKKDLPQSELIQMANKKGVESVIVSIGDHTENLYDIIDNMEMSEGTEIMDIVKDVLNPKE